MDFFPKYFRNEILNIKIRTEEKGGDNMTMPEFSAKIALKLCDGIHYNEDDIEVIRFGLEGIICTVINTLFGICLSLYFGLFMEFMIFNLIFIPLRICHKGYHCKTFFNCLVNSNILIMTNLFIISSMNIKDKILVFLIIFSLIIHYLISYEKYKKSSIIIALITIITFNINNLIYKYILFAILSNILLIGRKRLNEK